jgi:hypothetical protein
LIEVKGEIHEFVATCNSKKKLAAKHETLMGARKSQTGKAGSRSGVEQASRCH